MTSSRINPSTSTAAQEPSADLTPVMDFPAVHRLAGEDRAPALCTMPAKDASSLPSADCLCVSDCKCEWNPDSGNGSGRMDGNQAQEPEAMPREMSSRSANVRARGERRRTAGVRSRRGCDNFEQYSMTSYKEDATKPVKWMHQSCQVNATKFSRREKHTLVLPLASCPSKRRTFERPKRLPIAQRLGTFIAICKVPSRWLITSHTAR